MIHILFTYLALGLVAGAGIHQFGVLNGLGIVAACYLLMPYEVRPR